ncbi:hypothetical protein [Azonexus sp.]|uniref:hypothetical protein n=1 Tax=Azonexus sp. TaxID=1872668 RepID=UPI0027B88C0A|nr:hypothetical protein [Azonexus sp.]
MASIYLAHITVYDPALAGTRTLYLSTAGFTTGTANLPPGGVAHTAYDPRISQPANMRRDVFSRGTTGGESDVGYGAMELVNIDGGLDALSDYGLDGQPISIIVGDVRRGGVPSWTVVLQGTMEQPSPGWSNVTIRLRDRQAELSKPASPNKFAGSNALPAGLEGVVGDLQGKPKPKVFGRVFNIPTPCVNTSRLIYQVNDGAVTTLDAVYDRGVALAAGAAYASQAEMESTAPAAGQYRVWLAGGYFRLGSTPAGMVTADVTQGATAAARTVGQLLKSVATGPGGISAVDVVDADISALDTKNSAQVGIWVDGKSCREVLDQLCASIGAWWGFDRLGKFRCGRLEAPAGVPVIEILPADIISIDRIASNDPGRGVPAYQVVLKYKRIWATQPTDIAGAVTDARRAELREEYRTVTATDAAIQTKHRLAVVLEFETLLVASADASAEAARRLALYSADRQMYETKIAYDASLVASVDIGNVAMLRIDRFGMAGGKLFVVIGVRSDLKNKLLYLTLWG